MGISISTLLLGFHTVLEGAVGPLLFVLGKPPDAKKPYSGEDKLWKRWHSAGLVAMGYVGYLGLTQDAIKPFAMQTCAIFHATAGLAQIVAVMDGTQTVKEGVFTNMHLFVAMGFGAALLGVVN
jgi:hypothetical protein